MPPAWNEPRKSDHETCMARNEKMGKRKGDERKKAMSACPKG